MAVYARSGRSSPRSTANGISRSAAVAVRQEHDASPARAPARRRAARRGGVGGRSRRSAAASVRSPRARRAGGRRRRAGARPRPSPRGACVAGPRPRRIGSCGSCGPRGEGAAECGDELLGLSAAVEERHCEPGGVVDLLLAVEHVRQPREQLVRVVGRLGNRQPRRGNAQESVEVDTHGGVEHTAQELRRRRPSQPLLDGVGKDECVERRVLVAELVARRKAGDPRRCRERHGGRDLHLARACAQGFEHGVLPRCRRSSRPAGAGRSSGPACRYPRSRRRAAARRRARAARRGRPAGAKPPAKYVPTRRHRTSAS